MDFDDLVFRISAQGADNRGLGRWSYVTITGKHDLSITILSIYCTFCCTSLSPSYSQHLVYMADIFSAVTTYVKLTTNKI